MGTRGAMRELREDLTRALEAAAPTGPDEVFAVLCARLAERRGRPVVLRRVDFPPGTASGLYLDMADQDVICVQATTHPLHQMIIFGHEVWHMMAGHGGAHAPGSAVSRAAGDAGLDAPVQSLAARTDFHRVQETEAETFGLELGTHLRRWLDGTASSRAGTVARRIQTALGHRKG
ncbi:hypothetical protein ACFVIM_23350 [Streptomyces sp. NPDC057638]|uniref:hypothetical protein n=1 Tax=Streptomyces sp. NPDC057638 TaxID=3346190 RepID=UPI003677C826